MPVRVRSGTPKGEFMIGTNQVILNQATILEAIQFWIDEKQFKSRQYVQRIESRNNDEQFVVTYSDKAPERQE